MNNLKLKIAILLKFIYRFGILQGVKLFAQAEIAKTSSLKIPEIRNPIFLRNHTSDFPTFCQIFLENSYEGIKSNNPKFIIDGGANIGLFAIQMKNKYPQSTIICIEPDLTNFLALKKNIQHYDNIFAENTGIWNKDTKLKVYDKYNCGEWGFVVEEDNEAGEIDAVSIDSIMKKYDIDKIDILKLDIETSEKQLFTENYENWLPKTNLIAIELHDYLEPGCSKPFFEAINKTFTKYKLILSGENLIIEKL